MTIDASANLRLDAPFGKEKIVTRLKHDWEKDLDRMEDADLRKIAEFQRGPSHSTDFDMAWVIMEEQKAQYARAALKQRDAEAQERHRTARTAREEETLAIARKALTNSNTANVVAIIAIVVSIVGAIIGIVFGFIVKH